MSILQTKFHKEYPETFKGVNVPLMDGSSVTFIIKETNEFGGGWLTIPVLSPKGSMK